MRYFCTYFDSAYLPRGLALYRSLRRWAGEFELTVLCMNEDAEATLRAQDLPGLKILPLAALLARHPVLAAARPTRSKLEFYFTCTPWLMRELLPTLPAGELLTYLDADLYFFSSPQSVYADIGQASVAITPHRFPASLAHLERYGRYNVGWVSLRHDPVGLACAADWAEKCAEWCFNTLEADRYADQKYLDAWEISFPGTVSLDRPGINFAPWNAKDAVVSGVAGHPKVNGDALVFYHFHALVQVGDGLFDPSLHRYDAELSEGLRSLVYLPYLAELGVTGEGKTELPDLIPPVSPSPARLQLAWRHLLACLRKVELDSAERLGKIREVQAGQQQTLDYLRQVDQDRTDARAALDRTVAYLHSVEKDSAERLKSIEFYQGKLNDAYADLERNVAYLHTLEAEIAAHRQAANERETIIADLNRQLAEALARLRPQS